MCIRNLYEIEPPFPLDSLIILENAINAIEPRYCSYNYNNAIKYGERVFAYELYHQFKVLLANNNDENNYRIDGEIGKQIAEDFERCGVNENYLLDGQKNFADQSIFSPDLVFHLNQNDRLLENQQLIIEIKTKKVSNKYLVRDLLKLHHYIRFLNFRYAALISVNTDFDELCNQIRRLIPITEDVALQERFARIIIFNYHNRRLQVDHLHKILTNE